MKNFELKDDKKPPFLFVIVVAGMGTAAFLTRFTLVPSVGNNIGPFEALAGILTLIAFLYFVKNRTLIQSHAVVKLLVVIVIVAIISLPNMSARIDFGVIQLLLLVYALILVLVLQNLIIIFPSLLKLTLQFLVLGAAIAGLWVLSESIIEGTRIASGGPFRNRAHIGIYMVTAFWLNLLYFFWPNLSKKERGVILLVLLVDLYGVAISGRRSVYLSLFMGLGFLAISFVFMKGTDRLKTGILVLVVVGGLAVFSIFGSRYIPQLDFFQERIGQIDDRLELVAGTGDAIEDSDNFAVLQRQGMIAAITEHPWLGIGWGGFYDSVYSPTGHEMHSTPQRFLAELGFIGFAFYLLYHIVLWFGSLRLFIRLRHTRYQLSAVVFMVSLWSLAFSWAYNRSVTERTYWLLLALFISFETLANNELAKQSIKEIVSVKPQAYYHHATPDSTNQ